MTRQYARRVYMRGFTLVEVLVAITLMALVMVALGAALRGMVQTDNRVSDRLMRVDDFRTGTGFLKTIAGRVWAQRAMAVQGQGQTTFFFQGAPAVMTWVGVMPPRYGAGGRYFFRLAAEPSDGRSALVIRFIPWSDVPGFPDWSKADARVLAADLTDFSIAYEDDQTEPRQWGPAWPFVDRLPGRINIRVTTPLSSWPDLVLPLRQFGGRTLGGGAVVGGSGS